MIFEIFKESENPMISENQALEYNPSGISFCKENKNCIGLLDTKTLTPLELEYVSDFILVALSEFNKNILVLDYNHIIDWNTLFSESLTVIDQSVRAGIQEFMDSTGIKKIILPGDIYHYNVKPYHPDPKGRVHFTKALTEMAHEGKVELFGICGGMQGIMHSIGLKLDQINKIPSLELKNYLGASVEFTDDEVCNTQFTKIFIKAETATYKIIQEAMKLQPELIFEKTDEGDIIVYMPLAHYNAVVNDLSNREILSINNYVIAGITEDGVPEIVEDGRGFIHAQGHPEIAINIDHNCDFSFREMHKNDIELSRLFFKNFLEK